MTPAKEWKGRYDANGGYLVVKKDGDVKRVGKDSSCAVDDEVTACLENS